MLDCSPSDSEKTKEQLLAELAAARTRIAELQAGEGVVARLALGEAEKRYREMIEYAPVGIFQSTPEGRYLWANARLIQMYGYDSLEDLLENIQDITSQVYLDAAEREAIRAALESDGLDKVEVRRRRKDGSVIWVALSMRAVRDWNGTTRHYEGFVRDITVRMRDEELRRQIEGILAHDLRAPANNAIIVGKMLRSASNLTDQQRRLLALFELAGQNMLDTLNSSLNLYKIELGQYQAQPEPVDCLALIRDIAGSLSLWEAFEGQPVEILLDGQIPGPESRCLGLGDPVLLRTALQNLLKNALEAAPPGSPVQVSLSSGQWRLVEIRNQGVVPEAVRDRFFEKYATAGKATGTGLGTYSALMMVQAQGGDIDLDCSDGDDLTVVTVRLPRV